MLALFRLRDKGLLSGAEYARLAAAYQFLRYLEHRLQMEEDRQIHTLPTDPAELDVLARKMPAESTAEGLAGAGWNEHRAAVREIYERVIHAQRPMYYTIAEEAETAREDRPQSPLPGPARPRACRQPASRPRTLRALSGKGLRGPRNADAADARAAISPRRRSTSSSTAPIFADDLLRYPALLDEIGKPFELGGADLPMAPRCAASTAGRCSASRAEHPAIPNRSSRRWARPPHWPTASSPRRTASRSPKRRRRPTRTTRLATR